VEQRDLAMARYRALDLVHVVDPFVTPPLQGILSPVSWRLHGVAGARHFT
jgi:hypothetical protein